MINGKINRWTINQDTKDAFLKRDVRWGFGELGLVTFMRTYSWERALLPELYGENATGQETWLDCCVRVVEGTFTALRAHTVALGKPWDEDKAQCSAYSMLERMFTFKWLPPGRGLRMMGVPFVFERSGAPLQNCAFISTQDIAHDLSRPFVWAFEMLMMGTGVGFDARGAGTVTITPPTSKGVHVVEDSREGWAQAIRRVLDAHTGKATLPVTWDVSQVRPAGAIIRSFGGKASGPAPLVTALERLERLCGEYVGKPVDSAFIVDAMNIIAACVVSGGIRRSAQIAFGSPDDHKFSALKQDQEKLYAWRWASNNSILADVGMDYSHHAALSATNGEPGYAWLDTMRAYGRLADAESWKDERVMGSNPCVEQSLEHQELCNLVETFPAHHACAADYLRTLKVAYLYAKAVTLFGVHDPGSNEVMSRNRRVGCSVSGVVQAQAKFGHVQLMKLLDRAYHYVQRLDEVYSAWLEIPTSIKTTSVKPSGTVSLLAGATPGCHWDHSAQYIRRVRIAETSPLLPALHAAGYPIEADRYAAATMVVEFPVNTGTTRGKAAVPVREKLQLAADLQHWWADNQVSCTADFSAEEADQIAPLLDEYQHKLKGISFLRRDDHGYAQAPYETIDAGEYARRAAAIRPIDLSGLHTHEAEDLYCSGAACEVKF